jgi:hypothetical protein
MWYGVGRLNALDLVTGQHRPGSPSAPVAGTRFFPDSEFPNNATTFVTIKQHQRPGEELCSILPEQQHGPQPQTTRKLSVTCVAATDRVVVSGSNDGALRFSDFCKEVLTGMRVLPSEIAIFCRSRD